MEEDIFGFEPNEVPETTARGLDRRLFVFQVMRPLIESAIASQQDQEAAARHIQALHQSLTFCIEDLSETLGTQFAIHAGHRAQLAHLLAPLIGLFGPDKESMIQAVMQALSEAFDAGLTTGGDIAPDPFGADGEAAPAPSSDLLREHLIQSQAVMTMAVPYLGLWQKPPETQRLYLGRWGASEILPHLTQVLEEVTRQTWEQLAGKTGAGTIPVPIKHMLLRHNASFYAAIATREIAATGTRLATLRRAAPEDVAGQARYQQYQKAVLTADVPPLLTSVQARWQSLVALVHQQAPAPEPRAAAYA